VDVDQETNTPGPPSSYYSQRVAKALSSHPDLVDVNTYFPEGAEIAKVLTAARNRPRFLMGLANFDNGFLATSNQGVPWGNRRDHHQPQERLPHEGPGEHSPRQQAKDVREREVRAVAGVPTRLSRATC
jgi:hypothetical protein